MPRHKKSDESSSKKKSRKVVEDDVDEIEDEIIDDSPKKTRKAKENKPTTKKSSRKAKETDEDELSDIDVDEENSGDTAENDEVIEGGPQRKPIQRKDINPDTPIGELKTDDILSYLINVGTDTLNPQLKYGAIGLLNQLTGRRRRQPVYGSKSRNFGRGGYVQRGRGRPQPMPKGMRPPQNPNENLYGEND